MFVKRGFKSAFDPDGYSAAIQAIRRITSSPEEARELAHYLAALDWVQLFNQEQQEQEAALQKAIRNEGGYCDSCGELTALLTAISFSPEFQGKKCFRCIHAYQTKYIEEFDEWHLPCDRCDRMYRAPLLTKNHPVIKSMRWGYCPQCLQAQAGALLITCSGCGKETIDHVDPLVCNDCYTKYPDAALITKHRKRATDLSLPATLTLAEWLAAVEHFHHTCAYCSRPYTVIEHFFPLSKGGGGTTARNCIPACKRCNSRKGDAHPETLGALFPEEKLQRIRAWLASCS